MNIIDVSVLLYEGMPVWPGSCGVRLERVKTIESGNSSNDSRLECDVHAGTHVDAPRHFVDSGSTVERLSLDTLIGRAVVADLPEARVVTDKDLAALDLPRNTQRLLLRTRNSLLWEKGLEGFREDFTALTADAARWVVERGIELIGVDYLSVQRYGDSPLTHRILLEAGVVVVEGLNLFHAAPGVYKLVCLPLYLYGAEGAPARAVLLPLDG